MKSPGLTIDSDKRYTVWSKHPHTGNWMLERSYYGTYFEGEGQLYLESEEHYVTEEGRDPAGGTYLNPKKLKAKLLR